MMVCAQWGSVMTDSNKSEDDLPEFPGSNQTIKLTISNHELFYIVCVVFPGAGRRLTTLTYSQLGTWSWSGQGQGSQHLTIQISSFTVIFLNAFPSS